MKRIEIDGTLFVSDGFVVREVGTNLHYDPITWKGYQLANGRRVAITSYEAFGADMRQAREYASRWCAKARRAWEALS